MGGHVGAFPFGAASTERPPRQPTCGRCAAFVLGVYPSALHVQWTAPKWLHVPNRHRRFAALAVDVEPVVFWDGADAEDRIARWIDRQGVTTGNEDGQLGTFRNTAGNGSSGRRAVDDAIVPLGIDPCSVWFTDALPWFFVKAGAGQQAGAVERFNRLSKPLQLDEATLPPRPTPDALVNEALNDRRSALRKELLESETPLLITLGEEARRVAVGVMDTNETGAPNVLSKCSDQEYLIPGKCKVAGRSLEWWALKHPGQQSETWIRRHDVWRRQVSSANSP